MIDPKLLRTDPDALRAAQEARGESSELVDRLIAADEQRRSSIAAFENLRAEQKTIGKDVARAKGDEKSAIPMLKKASSMYQQFISKAGADPVFADAVKRAKERAQDIDDTVKFIEEGEAAKKAGGAPPAGT